MFVKMRPFKIYRYKAIWPYILSALFLTVFVSCGSDSPIIDTEPEEEGIYASIVLAGQGNGYAAPETKAGIGEDSDDQDGEYGTLADNYINYADLYVMTFSIEEGQTTLTDDSKLLEVMWKPGMENNTSDKAVIYSNGENISLVTQLNAGIPQYENKDFCVVAIANIKSFSGSLSSADLVKGKSFADLKKKLRLNFNATPNNWNWQPSTGKTGTGIPMFGVKKVNLKGYNKKIHSSWNPYVLTSGNSSTLWLLRALAKVTIEFADDMNLEGEKVDLKFVSGGGIGNKYAGNFWVIPDLNRMKGFADYGGTAGTGGTGIITKAPTSDELTGVTAPAAAKNLTFNASDNGKYAYMYLPEYKFDTESLPEFTVLISVGGGVQEFKFKFKEYPEEGTAPSSDPMWEYILRNHSYRFKVGIDFRIISVTPMEWGDAFDNEFDFG